MMYYACSIETPRVMLELLLLGVHQIKWDGLHVKKVDLFERRCIEKSINDNCCSAKGGKVTMVTINTSRSIKQLQQQ